MDQELGPVDFATLRGMGRSGTLSKDDRVRVTRDGEWRAAQEVPGLLAESAAENEFSEILDALESEHTDDPTRVQSHQDWYCRILDQELGPYSFGDVFQMASQGQLARTDLLRREDVSEWTTADEILGLFSNEGQDEFADHADQDRVSHYLSPQRFGATTGDAESAPPHTQPAAGDGTTENDVKRTLSEEDIVSLLSGESEGDPTESKTPGTVSHHLSPQRFGKTRESGAASSPPQQQAPAVTADAVSVEESDVVAADAGGTCIEVPETPSAVPADEARMEQPSAVGGLRSRFQGIARNRTAWVGGVGIVLVVSLVGLIPVLAPDPAPGIYEETLAMWNEIETLRDSSASEMEWETFAQTKRPRIKAIDEDLREMANSRERLLQLMLFCHRDCLPIILDLGNDAPEEVFDEMDEYMEEASEIYDEQNSG